MKKNKNKSTVTIQKLNVGIFELRLSEAKLEIENDAKTWKMVFSAGIMPYVMIVEMLARGQKDAIETLCTGFYGTMSMSASPEILKQFLNLLNLESRKALYDKTVKK